MCGKCKRVWPIKHVYWHLLYHTWADRFYFYRDLPARSRRFTTRPFSKDRKGTKFMYRGSTFYDKRFHRFLK